MAVKKKLTPITLALGAAFATSLAASNVVNAAENPFAMNQLSSGYMVADSHMEGSGGSKKMEEGKCGEGKCGGSKKMEEGKCGEDKCGMKMMDENSDGNVSRSEFMSHHEKMFSRKDKNGDGMISASEMKAMEGKCGEGKCGADKMKSKAKGTMEGKCGEGKCGGSK